MCGSFLKDHGGFLVLVGGFLISECFLWQRLFILLRSRSTFKVKRYFLWSRCTFLFDRRLFWFWLFMVEVNFFNYFKIKENFYDLIDTFQISGPRSRFYFFAHPFFIFLIFLFDQARDQEKLKLNTSHLHPHPHTLKSILSNYVTKIIYINIHP